MARVVVEHLTKIFPGPRGEPIHAVRDVSLTVENRELLVLVGPSGCGKTTTLRLIAGLEEPTSGIIALDGQKVNQVPAKDRDIAMVFQNGALYPHMSVAENLAFGLKLRRCARGEIEQRVREAAVLLDLSTCLDRKPEALSGGQRQRVALGRALVRRPKVFLFDEPLSNLDPPMRVQMRAEISRLHSRLAATMLYVTHDQVEAMSLGNRVAVIKEGAVQQVAEPLRLYRQPANLFVAGFIGSPPMNFFQGTLAARANTLFFEERNILDAAPSHPSPLKLNPNPNSTPPRLTLRLDDALATRSQPFMGKQVVLGIRAESIGRPSPLSEVSPAQTIEAVAQWLEPLGWESLLHLATAAHSFIARLPAGESVSSNERVKLLFDMSQVHLFDADTGAAV